jgi:hypothetical protein
MSVYLVPGVFGAGGQVLDSNGKPASGALVNTYAAGTTSTVQVFTTSVGNVAAANPVVCNSDGRLPYELWQTAGQSIKITVTDSLLNTLGTYDNLTGVNDPSNFAIALTDKRSETGAQTFTLHQFNQQRIVNVKTDFGAAGDATTDDTTAIQNAINSATTASFEGGIVFFPPGFYKTTSALTIPAGVILRGSGMGVFAGTGNSGGSVIRSAAAAGDVITISAADSVFICDLTIDAPSVTKAAGTAGIRVQGSGGSGNTNNRTRIQNCRIINMYDAVVWDTASNSGVYQSHIQDYLNVGIYSKQTGGTDSGHNTIHGCVLWDLNVGTSQASIRYDKGGDLRIVNNKLLGGSYGLRVALDDGDTGTLLIVGNSFEEHLTNDIRVEQAVVNKNMGNVVIVGNQFSMVTPVTPQSNIAVVAGTPKGGTTNWIKNVTVVGNVTNNVHNIATPQISIQDGDGVTIVGNVLNANGSANPQGIDIGGNVTTAKVCGNDCINFIGNRYSASTVKYKVPTAVMIFSSGASTVPQATTTFLSLADANASESNAFFYVPHKGIALNMMTTAGGSPAGSDTYTYTMRVNGADSALTAQASGVNSDGQDRTHVVAIPNPAGPNTAARLSLKLVTSATAAANTHRVSIQITEDD